MFVDSSPLKGMMESLLFSGGEQSHSHKQYCIVSIYVAYGCFIAATCNTTFVF